MRPAGRSETDSVYFDYPYFEEPKGNRRARLCEPVQVAIVGAGPIGMVAALTLAREGIRSVLIESKSTFNDGSRAICIARQSLHILESIDAAEPFLKKALGWTMGRSFYRGKQILEFSMPDGPSEKYRPMYNLQQQYIEQYLWQAIDKNPLIDMRWQSEVTGLKSGTDGVELSITDPQETYALKAEWLLAADGARSAIRKTLGLKLRGENYEGRYVIADVQMAHDYPTIRRALFDPESRPGGTVLIHKQPDNIWRIDYQLAHGENESDALKEDTVRKSVALVLKDIDYRGSWDLEWWSIYSANTLALDEYRHGRVFFIGDSAHIVPIFGVRGLNNGIADAHNIGWKLGWVLNGRAGEKLLDSYTPERRGATLDVFANATKSARFMTPPSPGWRIMRDAALGLALEHPFAGELANPRQMTPFTYAGSPAVLPDDPDFTGGTAPGGAMPDAALEDGFLSDRMSRGYTLVCFDRQLSEQVGKLPNAPEVVCLSHPGGASGILGAGPRSAYLVRPDLHVGARWLEASAGKVAAAMKTLSFGKG